MHLKRDLLLSTLCLLTAGAQGATTPPASAVAAEAQKAPTAPAPDNIPPPDRKTGSYEIGLMMGSQLNHSGLENASMEDLIRGLKEGAKGRVVTNEERDGALRFSRAGREALAKKNEAAAREFMKHNAKEEGIHVMPSGLQYRIFNEGDPKAKSPTMTDTVTVRYRASLMNGTEYDRSDLHDRPATFKVNSVLKGWQEAFLAMKPGAEWQLFVPPELGYGANPPPMVPPGTVLVYQMQLLNIDPAPTLGPNAPRPVKPTLKAPTSH